MSLKQNKCLLQSPFLQQRINLRLRSSKTFIKHHRIFSTAFFQDIFSKCFSGGVIRRSLVYVQRPAREGWYDALGWCRFLTFVSLSKFSTVEFLQALFFPSVERSLIG